MTVQRFLKHSATSKVVTALSISLAFLLWMPESARAHCDTMDGPVVKAARSALKTKNVNLVLIWVSKKDEAEVKQAFRLTLRVRVLNREASQLADKYFFETLVRLHRAGEGEPYTGLKPAGTQVDPVILAADKAIDSGSTEILLKLFTENSRAEIEARLRETLAKRKYDRNDIEAGRKYVQAYVLLLEHLEHLQEERSQKDFDVDSSS